MFRLECPTRRYAWGSRTLLPRFLGRAADGDPHAELWVGAHPGDPAVVPDGRSLDRLIAEEPETTLGGRVRDRFGARLPFLVKALAAAEPLSLQVHPTRDQARAGYAVEDAAGVPVGAPDRSYQDEFHKPELVFAMTRFEGMAGFRDVEKSAAILRLLALPWADDAADRLLDGPPAVALRAVVGDLLALEPAIVGDVLVDLGKAARAAEGRAHQRRQPSSRRRRERTSVEREAIRVFAQTVPLAERYPTDPGVLVTLLLNHVVLSPGEAMFLDAGIVHAYTSGFGIEVMASSDNVVRAGLTPKHIDVPGLLDIASFNPVPPPLWPSVGEVETPARFTPPVEEFALDVLDAPARAADQGPRVVLCLAGRPEVATDAETTTLRRGEAVFVPHADGALALAGHGRAAVASVPATELGE